MGASALLEDVPFLPLTSPLLRHSGQVSSLLVTGLTVFSLGLLYLLFSFYFIHFIFTLSCTLSYAFGP